MSRFRAGEPAYSRLTESPFLPQSVRNARSMSLFGRARLSLLGLSAGNSPRSRIWLCSAQRPMTDCAATTHNHNARDKHGCAASACSSMLQSEVSYLHHVRTVQAVDAIRPYDVCLLTRQHSSGLLVLDRPKVSHCIVREDRGVQPAQGSQVAALAVVMEIKPQVRQVLLRQVVSRQCCPPA